MEDMVEEEQDGGSKRNYQMIETMTLKTIPAGGGKDGPKEGMLRNHCAKLGDEATSKDKNGEGKFKVPSVPKRTPEKKGKMAEKKEEGKEEGDQKGKKVCTFAQYFAALLCMYCFNRFYQSE